MCVIDCMSFPKYLVCTKIGAAMYSSPLSRGLLAISLSELAMELCGWESIIEDGSGIPCFNRSACLKGNDAAKSEEGYTKRKIA